MRICPQKLNYCTHIKIWYSTLKRFCDHTKQFSEKIFLPKDFDNFKDIKNVNKPLK